MANLLTRAIKRGAGRLAEAMAMQQASPGAQWMTSGAAKAPICSRTVATRSFLMASLRVLPSCSVTYA